VLQCTLNNTKPAVDEWAVTFGTLRRGLSGLSSSLLAVPNVTAHPSTASVPVTALLYDGPLLCGFSMAIKRLSSCWPMGAALRDDAVFLSLCDCVRPFVRPSVAFFS